MARLVRAIQFVVPHLELIFHSPMSRAIDAIVSSDGIFFPVGKAAVALAIVSLPIGDDMRAANPGIVSISTLDSRNMFSFDKKCRPSLLAKYGD